MPKLRANRRTMRASLEVEAPGPLTASWYDIVASQLQRLVPRFGIEQSSTEIYRAYDLICRQSLALPPQTARYSRLNQDGTPLQFALVMGTETSPLQFLSEVVPAGISPRDATKCLEDRVRALFELMQLSGELSSVIALLLRHSTVDLHALSPDHGGVFWIGASFAANRQSAVKIYINGKNGGEEQQWARLEDFALHFGVRRLRNELGQLVGKMTPLGMAIVLTRDAEPNGRVYFSGYGNHVPYYENLVRHFVGASSTDAFRQYTALMLAEDYARPTHGVVFSAALGANGRGLSNVKVEFCAHCLFQSDVQARDRCRQWLMQRQLDSSLYHSVLDVVCPRASPVIVNSHVYLGLGWKEQEMYTTIYLKPHVAN